MSQTEESLGGTTGTDETGGTTGTDETGGTTGTDETGGTTGTDETGGTTGTDESNQSTYNVQGYEDIGSSPPSLPTQSPYIQDPKTPNIVYETLFGQETVKRLSSYDFELDSEGLVTLKIKECAIVLFYGRNTESNQLIKIFALAGQQVAAPLFAACNLFVEREVALAFSELSSRSSHPLHWAGIRGYPFILVYRDGYPVAFYNGDRTVQALVDFALTLACHASYREPIQMAAGAQVEVNYEMAPDDVYQNIPGQTPRERTTSPQYKGSEPIRGFVPTTSIALAGTQQAKREASEESKREVSAIRKSQETGTPVSTSEVPDVQSEEEENLPTPASPIGGS